MVNDFLPSIRGAVAHELSSRGYSQSRIAALLGITQARVSNYLSTDRSRFEAELIRKFNVGSDEVERYASLLAEDLTRSQVDGIFTLYSIWKNLLFSGSICSIHQTEYGVSRQCSVCMELHRPQIREERRVADFGDLSILENLREAARLLEDSFEFPLVMPEVSVNIAFCRPNSKTNSDVAAFPGRINRVHGRAKALIPPEFGCSNHMARVLMIFNRKYPFIRSVMNIKYDSRVELAIEKLGLSKTETHLVVTERKKSSKTGKLGQLESDIALKNLKSNKDEQVLRRLEACELPVSPSERRGKQPEESERKEKEEVAEERVFLVIDKGGEGLEPITYVLGQTPVDVCRVALKIAKNYHQSL